MKTNNKLNVLKYLVILGAFLWSMPVLAEEATSTPETGETTVTTTPIAALPTSTLILRYQDQIIWSGDVELNTTSYHDQTNNLDYDLNTNTVFSSLVLADQHSDAFNISDAQYNAGFDSFYLACINIASTSQNACYSWNYVVNNAYPSVGMDKYPLAGGETIYVYFSNPWKISASTSTFSLDTTTTLETWRYQFDNLAEPWVYDGNNLVDISITNPSSTGWWDQTITVTTTQTSASGTVDYKFSSTGTYFAKIVSLDWTKWSNPITLSVLDNPATTTEATTSTSAQNQNSGSSGPALAVSATEINNAIQKILNFLKSKQLETGAIVDLSMSDWAAMSFGANGTYAQDVRTSTLSLYDYLNTTIVTSTTETLNKCTEYPRHILGLLSAGFSKTNNQITDLKNKIKNECFADGLVGQAGINDDIFILISLLATDESANSEIVQAAASAIKADQQANGAFTWNGWPGQDVTGAAINALKYASSFGIGVDDSVFQQAKTYLHSTQLEDGGWGFTTSSDPLTTSWAMYGLNVLGEGQTAWTNSQNNNPWSVLINKLNNSGYYESTWAADGIDWFATKHAVPAILGKSWPVILNPISQTPASSGSNSGGGVLSTSTEVASIITSTIAATSTPETPTSTSFLFTATTEEPAGEVLGIKIENKTTSAKPKKMASVKTKLETSAATDTETNNLKADTKIYTVASGTESSLLDSPVREWIKKLLALSLFGAVAIGLWLGFQSLKKY